MNKIFVQYGCGFSAPKKWINFDASPTLRIQKTPLINIFFKPFLEVKFPDNVIYGDIIKGLNLKPDSCDAIYCSHVLEHLSYSDFQIALSNTFKILKPGGIFRMVMPDLFTKVEQYINNKNSNNPSSSIDFIINTGMGLESRPRGLKSLFKSYFGNSRHLWLWDYESTIAELEKAGFKNIRRCKYNDSNITEFKLVEDEDRFKGSIAIEANK